jgi:hypothetical protein
MVTFFHGMNKNGGGVNVLKNYLVRTLFTLT